MSSWITIVLGVIALGMTISLTVRQHRRMVAKRKADSDKKED